MNTNKIFTILFSLSLLFVSSISFANVSDGDDDPIKNKKRGVKIVSSSIQDGNATIKWYDDRIDHIEITSENGQFMPSIPVLDASSLHLHDLMNGTYRVQFKSEGDVLYNKEITVQR
tara:strand:- start:21 stop:371 length:351 start_codon:yes stop_codon:yes gene_type:complete